MLLLHRAAAGEEVPAVRGRALVHHERADVDAGPGELLVQLDRLQHRQPFGGQHDREGGRGGVGEGLAQYGEPVAAAQQDRTDLLVPLLERVPRRGGAEHGGAQVALPSSAGPAPFQAAPCRAEAGGLLPPGEQPVGPGGHHLRQRHQAGGVAARGGVEDDQVELLPSLLDQLRHPLEHRRLVGARGAAGEVHVLVDLAVEGAGHEPLEGGGDVAQVLVGGRVGVDLDAVDRSAARPVGQRRDPVADAPLPQVAEVVGGVGRDDEDAPAGAGGVEGDRRGEGRLADPALPAEEEHPTGLREAQQHRYSSSGERSIPILRCQSWKPS